MQTSDLADAFLIIVATSDPIVNQEVIQKAPSSALINAAAEADKGNVAFPSTFRRGKLNISISTNGASPQLAVKIRRQLESLYDEKYEDYVDFLYECRKLVKLTSLDKLHQRLLLKELLSEGFLDKHQQLMAITWLKKLARGGEGND
nr:NAD(P)-dependent oxidoreductase [Oceanobacillus massiliensis]